MTDEIKLNMLHSLANSIVNLNLYGIQTQFPISIYYVQPNLNLFKNEIFDAIYRNIDSYSETMLVQLLQLLMDREIECPKLLFNLILDKLIEKRKDPTLTTSLDLNYVKNIDYSQFKELVDYKKYILWAEISIDINAPIFRGFRFNMYTIDGVFYKEYELSTGKFIYSAEIIQRAEYLITGHTLKKGIFNNYKFIGNLPERPILPNLETKKENIKYAVDLILNKLGVDRTINLADVIIEDEPKYLDSKTFNDERKTNFTNRIFESLKNRFL